MRKLVAWLSKLVREASSPTTVKLPPPPGPIPELQLELVRLAVDVAATFGESLDFSNESVKVVETICAQLHETYTESGNDDGFNGIALEFGAYIATVIQHNFGEGVLERDHPDFGENSYPFVDSRGTIFPYNWCLKRIFDGPADDVWFKYQAHVLMPRGKV